MQLTPLDGKHDRTRSGVACNHRLWAAQTVERRRAWHAIIALGQHTQSDGVRRRMPSSPLDSTDGRPSSGVPCHQSPWIAHTIRRCRALHAIIGFGQHTQSNDVGRGMPSSPLGSTQDRTMSGVACHHRLWVAHTVGRRGAWHDITAFGKHTRSATSSVA